MERSFYVTFLMTFAAILSVHAGSFKSSFSDENGDDNALQEGNKTRIVSGVKVPSLDFSKSKPYPVDEAYSEDEESYDSDEELISTYEGGSASYLSEDFDSDEGETLPYYAEKDFSYSKNMTPASFPEASVYNFLDKDFDNNERGEAAQISVRDNKNSSEDEISVYSDEGDFGDLVSCRSRTESFHSEGALSDSCVAADDFSDCQSVNSETFPIVSVSKYPERKQASKVAITPPASPEDDVSNVFSESSIGKVLLLPFKGVEEIFKIISCNSSKNVDRFVS